MGKERPDGYEYQTANGYWYRKVDGEHVLLHHIIAAEKLGRPHDKATERVMFKDTDRNNLDPDNIIVVPKKGGREKRIAVLLAKRAVINEELRDLGVT
jgi:hypothetical protein